MTSTDTTKTAPGRFFSQRAMTAFAAFSLGAILAGSAAPTPLYRLYQEAWALSHVTLTAIFSVYAITLLLSLLTVGSLSDYVGRRPVIFAGLLLTVVAMGIFYTADSAAHLIIARAIQGIATGTLMSTLGATVLDTNKAKGPLINSVTPLFGMSAGALGASALATYAPDPLHLVYEIMLAMFLVMAVLVWQMPETVSAQPGALASLKPHVFVPKQARRALLRVTPVNIANWALGGFYLSLMPSLLRLATGLTSPFVGGGIVALLTISGAIAILVVRRHAETKVLIGGAAFLAAGVAVTLSGVYLQDVALLLLGTLVAGLGFGSSFFGATQSFLPLAGAHERAGLLSAFLVQSYLAFSLPVMLVGMLAPIFGLAYATYLYGGTIIVLALVSLTATVVVARG